MFAVLVLAVLGLAFAAVAQDDETVPEADEEEPSRTGPVRPSEDPKQPRRHFRVRDPSNLSGAEAERIYGERKDEMGARYALSRHPAAMHYRKWRRYNAFPYRSVTHGRRFVNNYANAGARAYGRFEKAGPLPVGSVIAKDTFTVTAAGAVRPGPLFLMEKMPDGFNYVSGNWRYTMIMPDGSVFGITRGVGSEQVGFCVSCHLAVEKQDHLYFVPARARRE